MSNAESSSIPDINSTRPFRKAKAYLLAGWHPIPVPERAKFPPEIGYTGRNGKYASRSDVQEWLERDRGERQNVAIRMGSVSSVRQKPGRKAVSGFETLGIDVDHYTDSDKQGGDTVREWEKKLGRLPATWISSARDDGTSGIRYFLVPSGLRWRGQLGPGVDIIQKAHRFAMVWPSIHPTAGQYRWYPPGSDPNGAPPTKGRLVNWSTTGEKAAVDEGSRRGGGETTFSVEPWPQIPYPEDLPLLPDAWVDELTNGRMEDSELSIDMESTSDEVEQWARDTFSGRQFGVRDMKFDGNDGVGTELDPWLCRRTRSTLEKWKTAIDSDAGSHDKIRDGHFELLWLGLEGHSGWDGAVRALEMYWSRDVGVREKRGLMEAGGEIWRSRINALRRIKAEVESGKRAASVGCSCWDSEGGFGTLEQRDVWMEVEREGSETERFKLATVRLRCVNGLPVTGGGVGAADGGAGPVESGAGGGVTGAGTAGGVGGGVGDDEFTLKSVKDPLNYTQNDEGNADHFSDLFSGEWRFVEGYEKWIYWDGSAWTWDSLGLMNRAFSLMYKQKMTAAELELEAARRMRAAEEPGAADLVKEAVAARNWAKQCGNFDKIKGCLAILRSRYGVSVNSHDVDKRVDLLGVANGVLELSDKVVFRQAEKDDMVVSNTNIPYIPLEDLASGKASCVVGEGPNAVEWGGARGERAYKILQNYLDTFLSDKDVRAWVQQLLGYTLYGQNLEKKFIFLYGESGTGKSTILEAVTEALGDYASSVEMEVFKWNKLNPALAAALPKRFITTTEAGGNREIPAEMIKRMTGNDTMSVEMKNSNSMIVRRPQFVPVIGTNNAPEIEGFDNAMKKRVEVVPFAQVAPSRVGAKGKDPGLLLIEEAGVAVLAWLVEGWKLYAKHRLGNRPEGMSDVQREFHDDMVPEISEFKAAMLVEKEGAYVTSSDLYDAYSRWANKTGVRERDVWSKVMLGKKMRAAGYPSKGRRFGGEVAKVHNGLELRHKLKGVEKIHKKDE